MKCFSVKNGKVVKGIPDIVPYDPKVKRVKGMIHLAQFRLEAVSKDDNNFKETLDADLTGASETAYFELTPHDPSVKGFILVAYDPKLYRFAMEYGDTSKLVYRSRGLHVAKVPAKGSCLMPRHTTTMHYFAVSKGALVVRKLNNTARLKLRRQAIERRREEGHTTVFEF